MEKDQQNIKQKYFQISQELRETTRFSLTDVVKGFQHLQAAFEIQGEISNFLLKIVFSLLNQQKSPSMEKSISESVLFNPDYATNPVDGFQEESLNGSVRENQPVRENKKNGVFHQLIQKKRFVKPAQFNPIKKSKIQQDSRQISLISSEEENFQLQIQIEPQEQNSKAEILFTSPKRSKNELLNIFNSPSDDDFSEKQQMPAQQIRLFKEKIREKEARRALEGHSCHQCQESISCLNIASQERRDLIKGCSKHRGNNYVQNQDLNIFPSPY